MTLNNDCGHKLRRFELVFSAALENGVLTTREEETIDHFLFLYAQDCNDEVQEELERWLAPAALKLDLPALFTF